MYGLKVTTQFKKDLKKARKRGKTLKKLECLIDDIREGTILDQKYLDHSLLGSWSGCRDCHIEPDWLLIYRIEGTVLVLLRTGSHSDLFE